MSGKMSSGIIVLMDEAAVILRYVSLQHATQVHAYKPC